MLGDNRPISKDSRYLVHKYVARSAIIGEADFVIAPLSNIGLFNEICKLKPVLEHKLNRRTTERLHLDLHVYTTTVSIPSVTLGQVSATRNHLIFVTRGKTYWKTLNISMHNRVA